MQNANNWLQQLGLIVSEYESKKAAKHGTQEHVWSQDLVRDYHLLSWYIYRKALTEHGQSSTI